jgi:hypothetical protein
MHMSHRYRGGWTPRGPELFGLLLIVVGAVVFLGNANLLRVSWSLIWPILIIGVGAVVLLSAVRPRADTASSASVPRDAAQQLELELTVGGGAFRLHGGAAQLVDVRSNRDDILTRVDRAGKRARVRLRQDISWLPFGVRTYTEWEVGVPDDVQTALMVQGGAGSFDVDLSTAQIVDARLTFGAAQARLTLPRPVGEVNVRISGGAASITIQVPPGVEARVSTSGGLLQLEGRNETPGYATARDRVAVAVTGGASSVKII